PAGLTGFGNSGRLIADKLVHWLKALHAAADHRPIEHAGRGEEGRDAMALGVMRQGVVAPRLDRQPRIKTMSVSLAAMPGIARPLEGVDAMRLQLARLPDALHRARRNPCRLGQPSAGLAGRLVRGG